MEWKDIIGKTVYHKTFGEGKITYCDKIRITVRFSVGEKKFFFPNAFEYGHLSERKDQELLKQQRQEEEQQGQKEKIKEAVKSRNIQIMLHFTALDNLEGILEKGILSLAEMEKQGIAAVKNDEKRLDFCPNCISCSISLPNAPLLFKFRKTYSDRQYVILKLKPELLWEKQCLFCKENAASNNVHLACDLSKPEALERMFGDYDKMHTRADLEKLYADGFIKDNMPTHNQAEVLVMGKIERKYISGIYFFEEDIRNVSFRNKLLEAFKAEPESDFSFEKVPDDFMRRCKNPEKAFWQDTKSVRSDVNQDINVPFYDEIPF